MDKTKRPVWEKFINLLKKLYNTEINNEQHIVIEDDKCQFTSLFHLQFSQFIEKKEVCEELKELDFNTPQLFNMGRNLQSEFAFSQNHRFILKMISGTQYRYFKNSFYNFYFTIAEKKNSLLAKTYGIYKLEDRENKTYFILMENLFYEFKQSNAQIISIYDLKGAQSSRITKNFDQQFLQQQQLLQTQPQSIQLLKGKDEDFKKIRFFKDFSLQQKQDLMSQIRIESDILAQANTMDYSLMIISGFIDQTKKCQRLQNFNNNIGIIFGIIDYFQEYNSTKKLENKFKTWFGIHKPDQQVSCVDSDTYRKRFQGYFQQFLED